MPPWHAEAPRGTFLGERRLTDVEKDTILTWALNGAPQGDPADLPPAPSFPEGWAIGTPDAVFEMAQAYDVPADGIVHYEHFYMPTNFTTPTWIQAVEVRPGIGRSSTTSWPTTAPRRTCRGRRFAKEAKPREVLASAFLNPSFVLPAGKADVRVEADVTFLQDATVWGLFPHTHTRGKRWRYALELPDGSRRTVLDVPRYDFNWQTYYMFKSPLQVPAGAKLVATAWYDNSAGNPANPDPKMDVRWGDQVWEEMHYTGIMVSPGR